MSGEIRIGFTGTKQGMTHSQRDHVERWFGGFLMLGELHHGDCVGADATAHDLARKLGLRIVIHPPVDRHYRAFKAADEVRPPKPYLVRDRDIVADSQLLIATPRSATEVRRSGTWATIRYARQRGIPIVIITPQGEEVVEGARGPELAGAAIEETEISPVLLD